MTDLYFDQTDPEKERDGIWVTYGSGTRLRIARMDSPGYSKMLGGLAKPLTARVRRNTASLEDFEDLRRRAAAQHLLVDWEGLEWQGKPVPYSSEKALEFFRNPQLRHFYGFVLTVAQDIEHFRRDDYEQAKEEIEGN